MAWPSPNKYGPPNNNGGGPFQFTPEQIEEAKAFQAGSTRAGQKSRPGSNKAAPAPRASNHAGYSGYPLDRSGNAPFNGPYGGSTAIEASRRRGMPTATPSTRGSSTFGGRPGILDDHFVRAATTPTLTPPTFLQSERNGNTQTSLNATTAPHLTGAPALNRTNPFPSGSYNDGTAQVSSGPSAESAATPITPVLRTPMVVGGNGISSGNPAQRPAAARVNPANPTWGAASAPSSAPSTSCNSTTKTVGYCGEPAATQMVSNTAFRGVILATQPIPTTNTPEQIKSFPSAAEFDADLTPVNPTTVAWDSPKKTPAPTNAATIAARQHNSNVGVNCGPRSTRDNPFPLGAYNDGTAGTPATGTSDGVPVQTRPLAVSVTTYLSPSDPFAVGGPLRPFEDPNYHNPNRKLIVNNWGLDQPGPFLPAHFAQRSATGTILAIHKETGIPLEELTSDGVSMPARPRAIDQPIVAPQLPTDFEQHTASQQVPPVALAAPASSQPAPAPHAGPNLSTENGDQADISDEAFFGAFHNNWGQPTRVTSRGQSSTGATDHMEGVVMEEPESCNRPLLDGDGHQMAATPSLIPSDSGTNDFRAANLNDSIWGPKSSKANVTTNSRSGMNATARTFNPTTTATASAYPRTPAFGAAAPIATNVLPPHLQQDNSNRNTALDSGKSGEKFLGDSMWAN